MSSQFSGSERPALTRRERRERQTSAARSATQGSAERPAPRTSSLFDPDPQQSSPAGSVSTILTVCTGNICRSALAEAVLATRLADLDIRVHGAGTQALVGHGMPREARELAVRNGVAPERAAAHRARQLTESLANDADLVLTMTARHSTAAVELSPRRLHRTFTVREFARLAASLDDVTLRSVADGAADPRARLNALVQAVSDQRGTAPRPVGDEDVVDPYRKPFEVYELSASQMLPALAQVERIVRLALRD